MKRRDRGLGGKMKCAKTQANTAQMLSGEMDPSQVSPYTMLILPFRSRAKWPPISKDFSQPSTLEILSATDWPKPLCSDDAFNSVFSVEVMMPPSVATSHRSKFQFFISCRLYKSACSRPETILVNASSPHRATLFRFLGPFNVTSSFR